MPAQTYGSSSGSNLIGAGIGQTVLYFLTLEEYNRYGVPRWHYNAIIAMLESWILRPSKRRIPPSVRSEAQP